MEEHYTSHDGPVLVVHYPVTRGSATDDPLPAKRIAKAPSQTVTSTYAYIVYVPYAARKEG